MAATLPACQQAAAQHRCGQAHGGRWIPPRRSAWQQQPACSRCAGSGKPRVLPRGIGGRSFRANGGDEVGTVVFLLFADDGVLLASVAQHTRAGASADAAKRGLGALYLMAGREYRFHHQRNFGVVEVVAQCDFHFALLGFGLRCATHKRIIEHHAPIVKSFLQQNYGGGSKPSNVELRGPTAALSPAAPSRTQGSTSAGQEKGV